MRLFSIRSTLALNVFSAVATSAIPALAQFSPGPNPITGTTTAAQTLAGGTGTISVGGNLQVSGSAVAINVTGSSTIVNNGTINQTGTGRGIRNNTNGISLTVTNNTGALIQTADADAFQMAQANSSVTMNNYGSVISNNASAGGAQAIDWNAITTATNVLNNYSTGLLKAIEADAVRPGVNGVVYNAGTILSVTSTGSSSDGVDLQNNNGVQITNDTTGLVEGARHGITGGPATNAIVYTTSVTNNAGGTIKGDNGAGINLDGFNANQSATIFNHGAITGNGITGDGDGVDVDGLVNLTNTGTIHSLNAFSTPANGVAFSEGISIGGGTVINSGTIQGSVASGNTNAVGRGITVVGNDTATPGVREAIYGNTTITNQVGGLIRGDTDSGIFVGGPASGFTVTINNEAGATIRGGGATAAAIQTGADNDTINNAGTVIADSSNLAIDMGAGNNTLNIIGGAASVIGNVSGGVGGTNALTISPGAGNTFSYSGVFSNFATAQINAGTTILSGNSTYAGGTTIANGGTLVARNNPTAGNSATGIGAVTVQSGGTLAGNGRIGGAVSINAGGRISPSNAGAFTPATLNLSGDLGVTGGSRFTLALGANTAGSDRVLIGGTLNFTGPGQVIFDVIDRGLAVGSYDLVDFTSSSGGLTLSNLAFGDTPAGFSGTFVLDGAHIGIDVTNVPEPTTIQLLGIGGIAIVAIAFPRRRRSAPFFRV